MVYETDFYTIRRPYTRPTITSYTVTGCRPCVWRTTPISPLGAHSKVRMSVLLGELNRIQNRPRMHLSYVPTEDFLNSRPLVEFDDETKHIRAEADRLMKYIYVPVPHQTSKLPPKITTSYERLVNGTLPYTGKNLSSDILNMSYYYEPTRATIGRGHLACITYAGGRGYPRRKHLFADENRDIRDEIKVRSFYNKNIHHQNRVDEALALPTGFAARLLTTDRKAYSTPDQERKSNASMRFRRSENKMFKTSEDATDFTPKKEKSREINREINESFKENMKMSDDIKLPQTEINKVIEEDFTAQNELKETSKAEERINNEIVPAKEKIKEKPKKIVEASTPTEEKRKSKKENRRKLSEKLSEDAEPISIVSHPTLETTKKEIPIEKVSEIKETIIDKPVEPEPITEKTVELESAVEEELQPADEVPVKRYSITSEVVAESESTPQTEMIVETKPVDELERVIVEDIIASEEIPKEEIPIEEPVATEKLDTTQEENKEEPVVTEDIINVEDEIKEEHQPELKEPEEVEAKEETEMEQEALPETEDIKSSEPEEQMQEVEPEVQDSRVAENETTEIPTEDNEPMKLEDEFLNNETQDTTGIIESPKEETDIQLNQATNLEEPEIIQEIIEPNIEPIETIIEKTMESDFSPDIQENADPIIEEPLSPEESTMLFSDQNIAEQPAY